MQDSSGVQEVSYHNQEKNKTFPKPADAQSVNLMMVTTLETTLSYISTQGLFQLPKVGRFFKGKPFNAELFKL